MRPRRENVSNVFVTAPKVEPLSKGTIICITFTNPVSSPLLRYFAVQAVFKRIGATESAPFYGQSEILNEGWRHASRGEGA